MKPFAPLRKFFLMEYFFNFIRGYGMMKTIKMKRVYEDADKKDGYRILVDRIWPRGVKKEAAAIDEWNKEVTPTTAARKEFDHDPDKFDQFKKRYTKELDENEATDAFIEKIKEKLTDDTVTLVYAAKDETYNHVVILKEYIEKKGAIKKD